jgi:hypothetical protein
LLVNPSFLLVRFPFWPVKSTIQRLRNQRPISGPRTGPPHPVKTSRSSGRACRTCKGTWPWNMVLQIDHLAMVQAS